MREQPWLTQKWTRIIMDHAYGPGVKGLCGNEDVGQMSAWYVLSAIGLHPVSPVDGVYILGSPLFEKVTVRLDPKYHQGKSFTVIAKGNSAKNVYIQSARLDGKELNRAWLTYREITGGGTLELVMGPEPNRHWASAPESLPPSLSRRISADEDAQRAKRPVRSLCGNGRIISLRERQYEPPSRTPRKNDFFQPRYP